VVFFVFFYRRDTEDVKVQVKNKILMITLVLLVSAISIAAQTQGPPPPAAKDYFPNTWDEYSFPAGKFRIRFPQKPVESSTTDGKMQLNRVGYIGLMDYEVSYVDYGVPIDNPLKVKDMLQQLKIAALNAIRQKGVQIIADREVTVDGHPGVFVHVEVGTKEVIRMQWVAAGSRLYSISTSSIKGIPQELEGKDDYEKIVTGFIGSFHIIP
jgi:hypothetical protein